MSSSDSEIEYIKSFPNVRVCISRSEFRRNALEYNIFHGVCNLKISRSDFTNANVKSSSDGIHITQTIIIKQSDLILHSNVKHQSNSSNDITNNNNRIKLTEQEPKKK